MTSCRENFFKFYILAVSTGSASAQFSVPSAVKLYDGLCHDIILDEVKDQAKSLLADSFLGIENVPVQQQMGLIVAFLPLLLKLVLFVV